MTSPLYAGATPILTYVLVGFSEDSGSRVFRFEGVGSDYSRCRFSIKADLALSRNGIRLQELSRSSAVVCSQRPGGAR